MKIFLDTIMIRPVLVEHLVEVIIDAPPGVSMVNLQESIACVV